MNEEREQDFFVNLLRPVLLKVVRWIEKHYSKSSNPCECCGQAVVKF